MIIQCKKVLPKRKIKVTVSSNFQRSLMTITLTTPKTMLSDLKKEIRRRRGFPLKHQTVYKNGNILKGNVNLLYQAYPDNPVPTYGRRPCKCHVTPIYNSYKLKLFVSVPCHVVSAHNCCTVTQICDPGFEIRPYHPCHYFCTLRINGSLTNTIQVISTTTFKQIKEMLAPCSKITLWIDGVCWSSGRANLRKTLEDLGASSCSSINAQVTPVSCHPVIPAQPPFFQPTVIVDNGPIDVYQRRENSLKPTPPSFPPNPRMKGPVHTVVVSSNEGPVKSEEGIYESVMVEEKATGAGAQKQAPRIIKVKLKELETEVVTAHKVNSSSPLTELVKNWLDVRLIEAEVNDYMLVYKGFSMNLSQTLAQSGVTEGEEIIVVKAEGQNEKNHEDSGFKKLVDKKVYQEEKKGDNQASVTYF